LSRLRKNKHVRRFLRRFGGARLVLLLRLLELPLRLAARPVVRRWPRDPRLIVFGAPLDRFADNSAYLFLRLSDSSDLRCIWITGSRALLERLRAAGYDAELRSSPRAIGLCLRAGWYVVAAYVSDVNRWAYDGAKVLNLWHGIPLKRIERDMLTGPFATFYRPRPRWSPLAMAVADQIRPPEAVLSTSQMLSERCFASAFGVPPDRCVNFDYPRADHFFGANDRPPSDLLIADRETWSKLRAAAFVIGYFPTWRDDDSAFMEQGGLSIERLSATVESCGGVLVFKPHFNTSFDIGNAASAVFLHPEDDLNAYLPLCDVLITDYSSVAFDFMLLDRPILYFVPDLADYRRGRGLYFEPEEMMPGPLLFTADDLCEAIARLPRDAVADRRMAEIRTRVWNGYEGDSVEKLREFLESDGTGMQSSEMSSTAARPGAVPGAG
jgi:CDP-glycerol glycerophosphotransferase (TagB/SpsB family)